MNLLMTYRIQEVNGFGFQVVEDGSTNPGYIFLFLSCNVCCETAVNLCCMRSGMTDLGT